MHICYIHILCIWYFYKCHCDFRFTNKIFFEGHKPSATN